MVFFDLKKAYDYVPREILYKMLEKIGIPPKLLGMIINLHDGSYAKFKNSEGEVYYEEIELLSGLKQGCGGAPLFFLIFFAAIFQVVHNKIKEQMGDKIKAFHGVDGNTSNVNSSLISSGN